MRNCPNCGATYVASTNKCPYCDTLAYDLSAIDFDNPEPIFLRVVVHGERCTFKVLPRIASITPDASSEAAIAIEFESVS